MSNSWEDICKKNIQNNKTIKQKFEDKLISTEELINDTIDEFIKIYLADDGK
jgi:hypothetical protein